MNDNTGEECSCSLIVSKMKSEAKLVSCHVELTDGDKLV